MESEITFESIVGNGLDFGVAYKITPDKGNLVYEYNPLRNFRVTETCYKFNNRLYTKKELEELLLESKITEDTLDLYYYNNKLWEKSDLQKELSIEDVSLYKANIELLEPGLLTDFETDLLKFDINHPVDILPQYSYDNSVNLILNDGLNPPRLINSRFSATERNKYQVVDRKGNNDTNIYDQGSLFDIDTSLYKRVTEIPRLEFEGVNGGGNLPIGNYHFYFRYSDDDGNQTDFVAESGLVSIFIGNSPSAIRSGFRDENSHKSVYFMLSNIDSSYLYVEVYYTRATSDIYQNSETLTIKIDLKFLVNNFLKCSIVITGYEDTIEVTTDEINPSYLILDSAFTQTQCQNMLFLGNVHNYDVNYKELRDLSLRFLPYIKKEDYPLLIDLDYNITSNSSGYYDPVYIYNNTGYWNNEVYRLGIVYILPNGLLSSVFNIRGIKELTENPEEFTYISLRTSNGDRNYIATEEDTYKLIVSDKTTTNENCKGVFKINAHLTKLQVLSIGIATYKEVIEELKKLGIKGMFFVRLRRIMQTLCQALTIGIDSESYLPMIPTGLNEYYIERFLDDDRVLSDNFEDRLYTRNTNVRIEGAICPEYDVEPEHFNEIFTGDSFTVTYSDLQPGNLSRDKRHFYPSKCDEKPDNNIYDIRVLGVEDNVELVAIKDSMFSARAGNAEEAFRYKYVGFENKITKASNLVRGSFGPYLAISKFPNNSALIDIKLPGLGRMSSDDVFKIRYNDKSPFFAISERISLNDYEDWFGSPSATFTMISPDTKVSTVNNSPDLQLKTSLYRGDCYICQVTHRVNRNFLDPSAPTNDIIVDEDCWKENYEVKDGVLQTDKFEKINLGDVNAVKLGMWVTFTVRSSKNLNIRSTDDSIPDEVSLVGHERGFYPYSPMSPDGSYKIPEALCYNKAFSKSVSERYNFELPDVPSIKNDFTNRISYSDIHINDAFKNGFRTFLGSHYRDYPKTYGSITKILELRGSILCVFEHGIAMIAVNERAVAAEGQGGNVYINTSNVLPENPKIISDIIGSQWRDSIIKTERGVYGVDTIAKKIWRTNGGDSFEYISDFKILEFLNNNISLTERELTPYIGIRNVKTHYNKYKGDILFTFYDNLHGTEEKVWNLCFNEKLGQWVTFYSWVPSFSENIYNQFFTFDRTTSKLIAKLGTSTTGSSFSDGVTVNNVEIDSDKWEAKLSLSNRELPIGGYSIEYTLLPDKWGNMDKFEIVEDKLMLKNTTYESLISKIYETSENGDFVLDERGRRIKLQNPVNADKIVILLNIKANVKLSIQSDTILSLGENYNKKYNNNLVIDQGYYESTIALIPKDNYKLLTTDFWKHGKSGIIDISEKTLPTYWYGKQHPFEFEFVVAVSPDIHKIFENLLIIGNKAEPESFHYEITGECYDFAKDKKNMYIRQEATKELSQHNGSTITFNSDYKELTEEPREISKESNYYLKSTIFPLHYYRIKESSNDIEDYYHSYPIIEGKNFSQLSGSEIVRYANLDEYRIWTHAKALDITKEGRLRGNMLYKEDRWDIQINSVNIMQRNESKGEWVNDKIPVEYGYLPEDFKINSDSPIPENWNRNIIIWLDPVRSEVKLKDKYIKIRVRYSGKDLAIISSLKTLYSNSYG